MINRNNRILKITKTAVFIALICVSTVLIRIPSPTKGYVNMGDCTVLLGGFLLGPICGAIAAGIGSAFADFLAGYTVYIPGTVIIKASMSLVMSFIPFVLSGRHNRHPKISFAFGSVIAELIMIIGYFFYEAFVIGGGFIYAFTGIAGNAVQGIAGAFCAYFIIETLSRTDILGVYGISGFTKRK